MRQNSLGRRHGHRAYAGLDFIKAAFCPLAFKAMPLKRHPLYADLRGDPALDVLEVGQPLNYPRHFRYKDKAGNHKTGTQIITAPFGLAPKDFDLFLGLYTHLRELNELPADGVLDLTADFIGRRCGFPVSSQKDYLRIRSRIFRFSYVKYTSTAFWNPETQAYDIRNFELYSLAALSRVTVSRRPIVFQFSQAFLQMARQAKFLRFDYSLYVTLSSPMRRLYLLANQMGWKNRDSAVFDLDEFALHQIGYQDDPDPRKRADGRKLRRQKIRHLLQEAEALDLIRPCSGWRGYVMDAKQGPFRGQMVLRWSRGPKLLSRETSRSSTLADAVEDDSLFDQVKQLTDEDGKPVAPMVFRAWVEKFGQNRIQKHIRVILAQKEYRPGTFGRSEVAALVDRLNKDYADPDWYAELKREERLSIFDEVTPNQLSMGIYENFFR